MRDDDRIDKEAVLLDLTIQLVADPQSIRSNIAYARIRRRSLCTASFFIVALTAGDARFSLAMFVAIPVWNEVRGAKTPTANNDASYPPPFGADDSIPVGTDADVTSSSAVGI
jgi:hypothetical protein